MVSNKNLNILKDLIKKKEFIKKEIKNSILKNIIKNKNEKPINRMFTLNKFILTKNKSFLSKQNNNICLKSGKIKSVFNKTNFSRHYMKKLMMQNNLQNFKINSW